MVISDLRNVMQRKGLTEERLSELTGIRQSHLNPIKNGKTRPGIETALRIARALRVPVERIWSLDEGDV